MSSRLCWLRRSLLLAGTLPLLGAVSGLGFLVGGLIGTAFAAVMVLAACVLGWVLAELDHRAWGYSERADDLLITSGVFVRTLIVVPYGRMQLVDVTASLPEQWLGIATVRLHTAAATTDAKIPGLPAPEAARLRDRLAGKGEARSVGL